MHYYRPWSFFPSMIGGLVSGVFGLVFSLAGIALYVLRSYGVYKMAKNTGMREAWLAWIPFLHEYLCALMGDRTRMAQNKPAFIRKGMVMLAMIYVLLRIFSPFLRSLFLIGWVYSILSGLSSLALLVVAVVADYWLFMDFEPSMAALFSILSVFRLDGIAKIIVRDNVPVGVAGLCSPKQPKYGV